MDQDSLNKYVLDVKDGIQSDLTHNFLDNEYIYLHGTDKYNLESILKNGFLKSRSSHEKVCFGRSFHIAKSYANQRSNEGVIIGVNLEKYLKDPNLNDKYFFDQGDLKFLINISPDVIFGHIEL